jgi:glutamyl-tRNA synthetase
VVEDGLKEVVEAVLAAYDSGELAAAVQGGHDGFKQ